MLLGIVVWFYLPDKPATATFLTPAERVYMTNRLLTAAALTSMEPATSTAAITTAAVEVGAAAAVEIGAVKVRAAAAAVKVGASAATVVEIGAVKVGAPFDASTTAATLTAAPTQTAAVTWWDIPAEEWGPTLLANFRRVSPPAAVRERNWAFPSLSNFFLLLFGLCLMGIFFFCFLLRFHSR